jgi:cell division protein FtsW
MTTFLGEQARRTDRTPLRTKSQPVSGRRSRFAGERAARWQPEAIGLLVIVGLLSLIGLAFVLSASSIESIGTKGNPWAVFIRQVQWEGIGLVALVGSYLLGASLLRRAIPVLWFCTVALLVAVRFTPLGVHRNGSVRWIGPSGLQIQPSEMAKLAIVGALASVLSIKKDWSQLRLAYKPLAIVSFPLILLVLLQPDLGTSAVIAAAGLTVLWGAGIKASWLFSLVGAGSIIGTISVHMNEYQWKRLVAFTNINSPEAYHIRQSLAGIEAGGLTGVGVGASRSKWGFLPNAHTDFIYAVIAEEVGFLGAMVVVALFAGFAMLGVRIALRAADPFSRLVAFGITGWITAQAAANIAAVTGVAPVTGVPMPFVSVGGTAFVSLMIALGVLLDIARRGTDPASPERREQFRTRRHPSQHASQHASPRPR